ncbi:MAG: energy transducer TonB [Crocinitomicaceae bacterium]|nr:energy transducer TonB [Crocinitomicaceae bacterium]
MKKLLLFLLMGSNLFAQVEDSHEELNEKISLCDCLEMAIKNPELREKDEPPIGCEWISDLNGEEKEKVFSNALKKCPEVMKIIRDLIESESKNETEPIDLEIEPPPPPPQGYEEVEVIDEILEFADVDPEFPCHTFYSYDTLRNIIDSQNICGIRGMMRFISENIIVPDICLDLNAQGRVFVKFCVEKDGSITNINIERNKTGCESYNKACKSVLRKMPKWKPGEVGGRYQRTWTRVPFSFIFN